MKLKQRLTKKNLDTIFAMERSPKLIVTSIATNHPGIDRCLRYIAKNFRKPIQVEDLINASGMSRRGFSKAFNRHLGANPGAVLQYLRIEHAKHVLAEHDLKLKHIARRCGYRSENTFCVAFQRVVGLPAKKFQRQYLLAVCSGQRQGKMKKVASNRLFLPTLDRNSRSRFTDSKNERHIPNRNGDQFEPKSNAAGNNFLPAFTGRLNTTRQPSHA